MLDRVVPGDGDLRAVQQEHPLVRIDGQSAVSSKWGASGPAERSRGERLAVFGSFQIGQYSIKRAVCALDQSSGSTGRAVATHAIDVQDLGAGGPLKRFIAASIPWVTQTATAWLATMRASSMTGRSATLNSVSTNSVVMALPA